MACGQLDAAPGSFQKCSQIFANLCKMQKHFPRVSKENQRLPPRPSKLLQRASVDPPTPPQSDTKPPKSLQDLSNDPKMLPRAAKLSKKLTPKCPKQLPKASEMGSQTPPMIHLVGNNNFSHLCEIFFDPKAPEMTPKSLPELTRHQTKIQLRKSIIFDTIPVCFRTSNSIRV